MALGIDFGTSNSTVGYVEKSKPVLIALEGESVTIPSALFYNTEDKTIMYGRAAISAYIEHYEGRLLKSLKSILGSSLILDATEIGRKKIPFQTILGDFIRHLKMKADACLGGPVESVVLGGPVESVVLGRPVRFVDENDAADRLAQQQLEDIARSCGFKNICFQYEPVAAALDYEQSVTKEELALIVDIGGGTSDFSIVRVSQELRKKEDRKDDILANSGVHIGGTDLDKKLSLGQVMPLLGYKTRAMPLFKDEKKIVDLPSFHYHELATWHKIMFMYNHKTLRHLEEMRYCAVQPDLVDRLIRVVKNRDGHRLAQDVENAKIALSTAEASSLALRYIEEDLEVYMDRKDFEANIERERYHIVATIQACLKQANVRADQIHTLFLTGGSTSVPCILQACQQAVPHAASIKGNIFGSVGMGLALDAEKKFGRRGNLETYSFLT